MLLRLALIFVTLLGTGSPARAAGMVVLQTDFGVKDGAVSAVKGVIYSVDRTLLVSDLTHEIPAYNVWEAAYRLLQTAQYWPNDTVFVSVVDPGVGTARRSVVAHATLGQYFVTPDNGTLTLLADNIGFDEVREIDVEKNRLPGSQDSYTFHGRDLYAYTAARLAAGKIQFADVGPVLKQPLVRLAYEKPRIDEKQLRGTIAVLDPQYGNLWTNIDAKLARTFGVQKGNKYRVTITHGQQVVYTGTVPFQNTFGEVPRGQPVLYFNSLLNLGLALSWSNFALEKHVESGMDWHIALEPST